MTSFETPADKIVYLMRGLPSCGKSFTARQLAAEKGVVCESDEYFRTQVTDEPEGSDACADLMAAARQWNFCRFQAAVREGISPVVVDRGNALSMETRRYAQFAVEHGYRVELKEPTSLWWQEIRVLLKYKHHTREVLYEWAERLAEMNEATNGAPASTIREWIDHWKWDLTVEEILGHGAGGR